MTLLGYGDGAIITRGLTSGRHIEVLGARLELCNIRLEGGQATVRISKRPRPRQLASRVMLRSPKYLPRAACHIVRLHCRREEAASLWKAQYRP